MKNKFLEQLLNNSYFVMNKSCYCVVPYKNAKLIYTASFHISDNTYPSVSNALNLFAVYVNKKVYILDSYAYTNFTEKKDDDVFVYYYEVLRNTDQKIKEMYFNKLDKMDLTGVSNDNEELFRSMGCEMVINEIQGYTDRRGFDMPVLTADDYLAILLGDITVEEFVDHYITDNLDILMSEEYDYRKARNEKETCRETDEMKIYAALYPLDVKTVKVYFSKNGKTVSGKMKKEDLLRKISSIRFGKFNDYFCYDFITIREGENVFHELMNEIIYSKDIVKITYGKKVLFQKE